MRSRIIVILVVLLGMFGLLSFAGAMIGVTGFSGNLDMISGGFELNSQTFAFANLIFPLGVGVGVGSNITNVFPTIDFGKTSTGSPIGNMNIGFGVIVQGDLELASGATGMVLYGGPAIIIKADLPIIYSKLIFYTSVGLAYATASYQSITVGSAIAYAPAMGIYYVF